MKIFRILLSLPKTVYYNFKIFNFQDAIKLPILFHYKVKIKKCYKGCIDIPIDKKRFLIKYGWGDGSEGILEGLDLTSGGGYLSIDEKSKVIFRGEANFSKGISIRVDNGGTIDFGENFHCNSFCFFASNKLIKFGDNNLIGWKVNIRDVDGHDIIENNEVTNKPRKVIIWDKVWIGAHVHILKGVNIPDNSVIAYRTLLTKSFNEPNSIIGGEANRILKKNIIWK